MLYTLLDASQPLSYISGGQLYNSDGFLHPARNLDTNVLIAVLQGTLHIQQATRRYSVGPYEFTLLRAFRDHVGFQPTKGLLSYYWVHFTMDEQHAETVETSDVGQSIRLEQRNPCNTYMIPEYGVLNFSHRVLLLFSQMLDAAIRTPLPCTLMDYALRLMLLQLSYSLLNITKEDIYPAHINAIVDYIRNNYYQPLTVDAIARHFHYNPNYLSADFRRHTRIPMIRYIHRTRVEIAKNLLVNYGLRIKEIAFSCGYADEKYFMKIFRQTAGVTPSEYRHTFSRKKENQR
jgi:AraC-like DNA-binding protein